MPKQTPEFKSAQETLAKQIRDNRPNIADSSVRTYVSILSNMYYREHDRSSPINLAFFKKESHILELLKEKTPQSRKTTLAAIVVLNGKDCDNLELSKQMISDVKASEAELNTQTKTKRQEENWLPYDAVKEKQAEYEKLASEILSSKQKPDDTKKEILTRYMILAMSSGVFFPPRRSEMVLIKLKDVDEKKDNYIDLSTNEFVYNQYKTAKKYGQQRVKFPTKFKTILKKYLSKIAGQTYLLEHMGTPYEPNRVTRTLNQIFGRKISTSMLRHIYLTDHYEGIPALKDMNALAHDMGQSLGMALQYVKR